MQECPHWIAAAIAPFLGTHARQVPDVSHLHSRITVCNHNQQALHIIKWGYPLIHHLASDNINGQKRSGVMMREGVCVTYKRSAFLGIPFGTFLKPWPWQSTWDPEQLHLWGHPFTTAAHSNPHIRTHIPQWYAVHFSCTFGSMVFTVAKLVFKTKITKHWWNPQKVYSTISQ